MAKAKATVLSMAILILFQPPKVNKQDEAIFKIKLGELANDVIGKKFSRKWLK